MLTSPCPRRSHLGEQRVDKAVPTEGYPGLRAHMVPPVGYVVQVGCVKCITAIVQRPLAPWGTKPWEVQWLSLLIWSRKSEHCLRWKGTCVHHQWSLRREFPWIGKPCDPSTECSARCPEASPHLARWRRVRSNSQGSPHQQEMAGQTREEEGRFSESPTSCLLGPFAVGNWRNALATEA